MTPVVE
jgi:hypothetical protein